MKIRNRYFWIAAVISLIIDIKTKQEIVRIFDVRNKQDIMYFFGMKIEQAIIYTPDLDLKKVQGTLPLIPDVFHFTYLRNFGAAGNLFDGHGGDWLAFLSLLVSTTLVIFGIRKAFSCIWEQLGFGFILAGAAGNGIDRLFFGGSVADFIDVRIIHFPVFNWADISINIGVICLLIYNFIYLPRRSNSHQ
jgi:signal peptidase II